MWAALKLKLHKKTGPEIDDKSEKNEQTDVAVNNEIIENPKKIEADQPDDANSTKASDSGRQSLSASAPEVKTLEQQLLELIEILNCVQISVEQIGKVYAIFKKVVDLLPNSTNIEESLLSEEISLVSKCVDFITNICTYSQIRLIFPKLVGLIGKYVKEIDQIQDEQVRKLDFSAILEILTALKKCESAGVLQWMGPNLIEMYEMNLKILEINGNHIPDVLQVLKKLKILCNSGNKFNSYCLQMIKLYETIGENQEAAETYWSYINSKYVSRPRRDEEDMFGEIDKMLRFKNTSLYPEVLKVYEDCAKKLNPENDLKKYWAIRRRQILLLQESRPVQEAQQILKNMVKIIRTHVKISETGELPTKFLPPHGHEEDYLEVLEDVIHHQQRLLGNGHAEVLNSQHIRAIFKLIQKDYDGALVILSHIISKATLRSAQDDDLSRYVHGHISQINKLRNLPLEISTGVSAVESLVIDESNVPNVVKESGGSRIAGESGGSKIVDESGGSRISMESDDLIITEEPSDSEIVKELEGLVMMVELRQSDTADASRSEASRCPSKSKAEPMHVEENNCLISEKPKTSVDPPSKKRKLSFNDEYREEMQEFCKILLELCQQDSSRNQAEDWELNEWDIWSKSVESLVTNSKYLEALQECEHILGFVSLQYAELLLSGRTSQAEFILNVAKIAAAMPKIIQIINEQNDDRFDLLTKFAEILSHVAAFVKEFNLEESNVGMKVRLHQVEILSRLEDFHEANRLFDVLISFLLTKTFVWNRELAKCWKDRLAIASPGICPEALDLCKKLLNLSETEDAVQFFFENYCPIPINKIRFRMA